MSAIVFANQSGAQTIDNLQVKLEQQQQQIQMLKARLDELDGSNNDSMDHPAENALEINGFFDFTAHTTNNSGHPFDLGGLELDLQYDKARNFAVSAALVWSGDDAEVAVAVIDYHVYDHDVPTRGDLFDEPGFHFQMGRFDIPFGIDYEYFAAPDRPNVTAPLTTERIQDGGFNGDGLRTYGNWSIIDYVFYWTNSLYDDEGSSVGARIGLFPGKNPYRVHSTDVQKNFVLGLSWLRDMDSEKNERNTLYAFDISAQWEIVELIYEFISRDSVDEVILPDLSSAGPADEEGYNVRLLLDFDPFSVYIGYGEWEPEYTAIPDEDAGDSFAVSKLERGSLGAQYSYNEYVQFKLEYYHHLNTQTAEPDFEQRRLTFQMVAGF